MNTVFFFTDSWQGNRWLYERLGYASNGDTIVLQQDAVLGLQSPIALASFLAKCAANGITVVAMQAHCQLRGVENHYPQVRQIDDPELVQLVVQHARQVSW